MTTTLETPRLILRHPVPGDWQAFHNFMMSDRSTIFGCHRDLAKTFRSFAAELGHWEIFGHGMWAVTIRGDDAAIGLVGPWTPPDWPEPEIGWMILSGQAEGTGIAAEAARAAVTDAFQRLGWPTAVSYIDANNDRSIRLAERLGAVLDPDAPKPGMPGTILVYRHPVPAVVA